MLAPKCISSRGAVRCVASPVSCSRPAAARRGVGLRMNAVPTTEPVDEKKKAAENTEKYGLEVGLFKVLSSTEEDGKVSKTDQAKELLKVYGSAYLITSITLAIISFTACYFAVNAGVDVSVLLSKIGIQVNDTNETVGTFAIAYAAHKALSPVRFPPTVALTPIVAKWTGRKKE